MGTSIDKSLYLLIVSIDELRICDVAIGSILDLWRNT